MEGTSCASLSRLVNSHTLVNAPLTWPTDDDNDAVLFEKIKKGNYDADDPIWENISLDAKDVVAKLLTVDSEKRLTADEALQHPWVMGSRIQEEKGGSLSFAACRADMQT